MKSLKNFIYENYSSKHILKEELDDNLFWLLDKWFERNENQKSEFIEIVVQCKQEGDKVNIDNLKKLLHKTELEKDLKEFINFLDNDLEPLNNKDYLYALKQVIEVVIGKKEKNKYLENNKENQVSEKLIINKNIKVDKYHYQPKNKNELIKLIKKLINKHGDTVDLNDIDTSKITDMSNLFANSQFNGDISEWDVSNVEDMHGMFTNSDFNGDISKWNVSSVEDMSEMFKSSKFTGENGNISKWDISNVRYIAWAFANCPLEKNPPSWYKNK